MKNIEPTILIVEDHPNVRLALRDWLGVIFPEYEILETANGSDALEFVNLSSPCLVLMDINLPDMNGIEATRRIKALQPAVQVVMLSICEGTSYIDKAMAAGASAYVTKRKMQQELIPTLSQLLPNCFN
jgi:DNA-binding NarL/FixJ family response regulator